MADQVFPYHLAGFAVGAFATGYSTIFLKQYFTRLRTPVEKTIADLNILPMIHTRKRKRDPDVTSHPATKRRLPDAVNRSLATKASVPSDDLNASSPINSVKVNSNSEQSSVEITIGNVSSRPTYYVHTKSHYGVKIAFRKLNHHAKRRDAHATAPPRYEEASTNTVFSTTENKGNEEDYHSDRTMVGDKPGRHDHGSRASDEQSEKANRSADREEKDDDLDGQIGERPSSEIHEEEDDDLADHAVKEHGLQYHNLHDNDSEDDKQEDGGASNEAVEIVLYRQNKKVDLKISISKGRTNSLEIMVQNRQPGVHTMRRRQQGKL